MLLHRHPQYFTQQSLDRQTHSGIFPNRSGQGAAEAAHRVLFDFRDTAQLIEQLAGNERLGSAVRHPGQLEAAKRLQKTVGESHP